MFTWWHIVKYTWSIRIKYYIFIIEALLSYEDAELYKLVILLVYLLITLRVADFSLSKHLWLGSE